MLKRLFKFNLVLNADEDFLAHTKYHLSYSENTMNKMIDKPKSVPKKVVDCIIRRVCTFIRLMFYEHLDRRWHQAVEVGTAKALVKFQTMTKYEVHVCIPNYLKAAYFAKKYRPIYEKITDPNNSMRTF